MNFFMEKIHSKKRNLDKKIMHWKENTKFCIIRRSVVAVKIYQQFADKSLQITIYPETKDVDIQFI